MKRDVMCSGRRKRDVMCGGRKTRDVMCGGRKTRDCDISRGIALYAAEGSHFKHMNLRYNSYIIIS